MLPIGKQLRQLLLGEEGLAATEYATMLALIIIVCISMVRTIGTEITRHFENLVLLTR